MTERLPKGWTKTKLGKIVEPSRQRVSPSDDPSIRYVGLEHIEPHSMKLLGFSYAREVRSSSVRFSAGDILYGKMRPYLNKVWVAEFDGICSAEFLVFHKTDGVDSQFLALRLNADDFVQFANGQVSGERPRVDFDKLSTFPILLPPSDEQRRLLAKLTSSLLGLDKAATATLRAIDRIKLYRAAVLDSALTGQLTHEWHKYAPPTETASMLLKRILHERRLHWEEAELKRLAEAGKTPKNDEWKLNYPEPVEPELTGLPQATEGWIWASAEQLTEATRPISYGVIKLGAHVRDGVPVLRSSDVRPLRLDLSHVKRVSKSTADGFQRTYLKGGEVLVTIRGTLGGVVSVPAECAGYNISREVAMLALVEPRTSQSIAYFIGAKLLQEWLGTRTRGIAYTGINIETLRGLPIPVSPLDEQFQIVHEVEQRLTAADRLSATLQQQIFRARSTRQLLLVQAFSGALVPQNPNEKPAYTIIERISAARDLKDQKSKGNRMSKSKTKITIGSRQDLLAVLKTHVDPMTPEELFNASGHSQESVDQFFAELRQLTTDPVKVVAERNAANTTLLKAVL